MSTPPDKSPARLQRFPISSLYPVSNTAMGLNRRKFTAYPTDRNSEPVSRA
jgi:hypothetical protein